VGHEREGKNEGKSGGQKGQELFPPLAQKGFAVSTERWPSERLEEVDNLQIEESKTIRVERGGRFMAS